MRLIIFIFVAIGLVQTIFCPPPESLQCAWIGSAITAGASLIGGLFGNKSQNKNIDKQLQAQKEENQKNRDYNLMLAQMQNQWNQDQWERENDYNSPESQMERLKKAGLNPDLMMSNGANNISGQLSGGLTSGSPSSPVDMSALGQKATLGQAIQQSLRDSMIGAQIDNIKAQTEKTREETKGSAIDNLTREMSNALDIDIKVLQKNLSAQQAEMMEKEYEKLKIEVDERKESLKQVKLETLNKEIENTFKDREIKAIIKKLENEANISEQDAKFAAQTLTYRVLGVESESAIQQDNARFAKFMNEMSEKNEFGYIGTLLLSFVKELIGILPFKFK